MRAAARLAVAVPALLGLGCAILAASAYGLADTSVYEAQAEISTWAASGAQPGLETLRWIRDAVREELIRDPENPSLHEILGRLALFTRSEDAADEAIASFTRALQYRPGSPYSWANLAEALYRKGDTGLAFEQALRSAGETGPWEPQVQRTVAEYGLAVWNDVSSSTRYEIDRMVANGMARNASEILQISLRRGRLGVACGHLVRSTHTDPKWVQLCQSTEAT